MLLLLLVACGEGRNAADSPDSIGVPDAGRECGERGETAAARTRVIIDSDANNELDDQHAIAYALFSSDELETEAVAVHRTALGGGIDQHLAEARRVVQLSGAAVPVLKGADGEFNAIKDSVREPGFDGQEAVDYIVQSAFASDARRLTLVAIGKLTDVALALHKDPSIAGQLRVVWLGSNWPDPGEYNLLNDEAAASYVVDSGVELAIAVVRYGAPSGTDAVRVETAEIKRVMPGLGPRVDPPVAGRSGGSFSSFGDYSVELFSASNAPSRALFDVAAIAVVKNAGFAQARVVAAPELRDDRWSDRPDAGHSVTFYEMFDRCSIVADFFDSMRNYVLP